MILFAMPRVCAGRKGTNTEGRGRYPESPSQQPHRARPSFVARGQPSNKRLKLSAPVFQGSVMFVATRAARRSLSAVR